MDNVTHALFGVLVAEALHRTVPPSEPGLAPRDRRRFLVWLLVVGNNLPDLDFVYARITEGKLGYLLHHRGHTHTLVAALAIGALLYYATRMLLRRRSPSPSFRDQRLLAVAAFVGPLLHLLMDYSNDYGVHPFWPIYDGWFYGDSVFIVEPFLWVAVAPLLFVLETRSAELLLVLVLAAGVVLSWSMPVVSAASAGLLTLSMLAALAVGRRLRPKTAALGGLVAWGLITALFVGASAIARMRADELARAELSEWTVLDRALSVTPENPICWQLLLVGVDRDRYIVRSARLSLLPSLVRAERCPPRAPSGTTAPLVRVAEPSAAPAALVWQGDFSMPRAALVQVADANCEFAAFLRYARVPWLARRDGRLLAGDLRYDREPSIRFAELELDEPPKRCPSHVPPWLEPRHDVLSMNALR